MAQPHRRIRRIIIRAATFLLLGAIVNVAVAWGLILSDMWGYHRQVKYDVFDDRDGLSRFPFYVVRRAQSTSGVFIVIYRGAYDARRWTTSASVEELIPNWGKEFVYIPELDGLASGDRNVDPLAWGSRFLDAQGWPCLAVWQGTRLKPPKNIANFPSASPRQLIYGAIPIKKPRSNTTYFLPYLPIWPGFAINTIFYAVIPRLLVWLLYIAPDKLCRRHRIKRGLCVACGYDLRASRGNCPECGAAIPASLHV